MPLAFKAKSATGMWPISNPFNPYRNQLWVLQCCIGPLVTLQNMQNIAACLRASRNPQSIGRGRHVRRPSVTALRKMQANKLTNAAGLNGDRVRLGHTCAVYRVTRYDHNLLCSERGRAAITRFRHVCANGRLAPCTTAQAVACLATDNILCFILSLVALRFDLFDLIAPVDSSVHMGRT